MNDTKHVNFYESVMSHPNFERFMPYSRFKVFRKFVPDVMINDQMEEDGDPWWRFAGFVDKFNANRKLNFLSSLLLTGDETMSAQRPRKTKTGGLPHLSYIFRKPEPLGTEFKNVACAATGVMTYLEIQRGKTPMRNAKYSKEYGGTGGCTVRMMEGRMQPTSGMEQEIFLGDSWFGSVRCAAALGVRNIGAFMAVSSSLFLLFNIHTFNTMILYSIMVSGKNEPCAIP